MMLQLSDEQFKQVGTANFIETMVSFVTHQFDNAKAMTESDLSRDVTSLTNTARLYGLSTFASAAVFVVLSWIFGTGFEQSDSRLLALLTDARLSPGDKAKCLQIWGLGAAQELSGAS